MLFRISWLNRLLLAMIVFIAVFSLTKLPPNTVRYEDYTTLSDNFETVALQDSLPKIEAYKAKLDSLINLDVCNRSKLSNRGKGVISPVGGFTVIRDPDDCGNLQPYNYTGTNKYFIAFSGYQLSPNAEFSTHNGKNYIRKQGWSKNADGSLRMGWQQKEIPVRYVSTSTEGFVLFPVTKGQLQFIKVLTYLFIALLVLWFLYIVGVLPFRILLSIANCEPFTRENIQRMRIIGFSFIGFAIIPNLLALLLNLVFSGQIPSDIYLPIRNTLLNNSWLAIAGLAVLIISGVFRKGYELKVTNNLYN